MDIRLAATWILFFTWLLNATVDEARAVAVETMQLFWSFMKESVILPHKLTSNALGVWISVSAFHDHIYGYFNLLLLNVSLTVSRNV